MLANPPLPSTNGRLFRRPTYWGLRTRYKCSTHYKCSVKEYALMLNRLPPRERQIVELLYQRGDMAVADICDALPDRLSGSAVRAMLKRLEDKGFVRRHDSERGYLYSP